MKHQHRIGRGRGGRFERNKIFNNKRKMRKEIEEKEMEATRTACENIDSGSVKIFKDLPLSNKTLLGLQDSGYTEPTEIQRESLCLSLRGLDLLGAAKTGSGKTLAFIIPTCRIKYVDIRKELDTMKLTSCIEENGENCKRVNARGTSIEYLLQI